MRGAIEQEYDTGGGAEFAWSYALIFVVVFWCIAHIFSGLPSAVKETEEQKQLRLERQERIRLNR